MTFIASGYINGLVSAAVIRLQNSIPAAITERPPEIDLAKDNTAHPERKLDINS